MADGQSEDKQFTNNGILGRSEEVRGTGRILLKFGAIFAHVPSIILVDVRRAEFRDRVQLDPVLLIVRSFLVTPCRSGPQWPWHRRVFCFLTRCVSEEEEIKLEKVSE